MPLDMEETGAKQLFSLLGLPVYPYAVFLVAGALLGLIMALRRARRTRFAPGAVLTFAALAVPLGLIFGRLIYCACRYVDLLDYGLGYLFRVDYGGFALMGAALGLLLAAFAAAKIEGVSFLSLLDCVLPGLMLLLAAARFGEGATTNGLGPEVSCEALRFFPLAMRGLYGEYCYAVFMGEGLTALIAAVWTQSQGVSYADADNAPPRGWTAGCALIIVCAAQIVWESARRDEVLKNGFVRYTQIFAAVVLFIVLLCALIKMRPAPAFTAAVIAIFLALLGVCGFVEFLIDGKVIQSVPIWLCYLLSSACAGGAGALTARALAGAYGKVGPGRAA